jgi:Methyltransferase domain
LGEKIRPINLSSLDVARIWKEPIGMLFIDGSHAYEWVKADLLAWLPFVIEGGLVAMHDANAPDVMRAADEFSAVLELVEVADITNVYRVQERLLGKFIKVSEDNAPIAPKFDTSKTFKIGNGGAFKIRKDNNQ